MYLIVFIGKTSIKVILSVILSLLFLAILKALRSLPPRSAPTKVNEILKQGIINTLRIIIRGTMNMHLASYSMSLAITLPLSMNILKDHVTFWLWL